MNDKNQAYEGVCVELAGHARPLLLLRPLMKQTGFPKGEPDSLYHRDSLWISSYHIQNSFQSNITYITHVTTPHGFIYYIIQKDYIRISEYKPLGLKENKQKAETISSLLGNLRLHESSPQAARSVAQAILNSFFHRLG